MLINRECTRLPFLQRDGEVSFRRPSAIAILYAVALLIDIGHILKNRQPSRHQELAMLLVGNSINECFQTQERIQDSSVEQLINYFQCGTLYSGGGPRQPLCLFLI